MNVDEIFSYHKPDDEQIEKYKMIRNYAKILAELIIDLVPENTEREISLNGLRSVVMWANAGIALGKCKNALQEE